jgi:hypothetical protein
MLEWGDANRIVEFSMIDWAILIMPPPAKTSDLATLVVYWSEQNLTLSILFTLKPSFLHIRVK